MRPVFVLLSSLVPAWPEFGPPRWPPQGLPERPGTLHRQERGLSVVEVLLAVVVFVLAFLPMLRLFSESGLSQQRMIRDFPVALNIAERVVNTIENEIEEGRFNPVTFQSPDPAGVDITEQVLENQAVNDALQKFSGQEMSTSAKFMPRFQVRLLTQPGGSPDLVDIRLRFLWSDSGEPGSKFRHEIVLNLLKSKR